MVCPWLRSSLSSPTQPASSAAAMIYSVVEAVLIARLDVQSATIEFLAGRDGPEREEHGVEKAPSLIRRQRCRDLPGEDVQGFLYDLIADRPALL